jgi:penicillin G amidase
MKSLRTFLLLPLFALALPAAAQDWTREAQARVAILAGTVHVAGLHQPVRVQRDRWGVAHIYAADAHDLFLAQGYVVSQDRLFQMEVWKRAGQGRLAEILGPDAVQRDIGARQLRYRGDWQAEYASYAADAREILEAFTSGINAYIAQIEKGPPGLPVEFRIAGFRPEPWVPTDCLNRLAAYSMMSNASDELQHAQVVALLGPERAAELFMLRPHAQLVPAPGIDFTGLSAKLLANIVSSDQRIPFPASDHQESNDWTLSGTLAASGKPLLANDPHRVIALPSLRYIVHLSAPGWNVIGAGEPGLPGVAAGHNDDIAWGFTIFGLDQEDLYLEALNPDDPHQYRTAHGWQAMTEEPQTIHVRGAPDIHVIVRATQHGPVLWQDARRALALRWIGAEPGTAGYLGSLTLDRAHDWQQFEDAMPHWKVPSENIVFADRQGDIGEHSTGLAPLRRTFNGLLPVPGTGGYEWAGFIPNGELPHSLNPPGGFIATANQQMIPDNYPYAVGYQWADPARFDRIEEVLGAASRAHRKLTVIDMQALQSDVISLHARRLQSLLRSALRAPDAAAAPIRQAAGLLLHWDCALRADSAAAALYEEWVVALRSAVTQAAVPETVRAFLPVQPLEWVLAELERPHVAALHAAPVRARLLLSSLGAGAERLRAVQGPDPQHWSWGALHQQSFRHPLDAQQAVAPLFDRGPVARSGDGGVVQATSFTDGSFDQTGGASYREIFDVGDWDNSVAINVPGQSGQPGARHYDDLLPLWSTAGYFPLKFSRAAVDQVTTDTLILQP